MTSHKLLARMPPTPTQHTKVWPLESWDAQDSNDPPQVPLYCKDKQDTAWWMTHPNDESPNRRVMLHEHAMTCNTCQFVSTTTLDRHMQAETTSTMNHLKYKLNTFWHIARLTLFGHADHVKKCAIQWYKNGFLSPSGSRVIKEYSSCIRRCRIYPIFIRYMPYLFYFYSLYAVLFHL